jgi:hypothetical protein
VIEELELKRPVVITAKAIDQMRLRLGVEPPANRVIEHLAERGWLLKTGVHGVWEFIPGERAGAHSIGDQLLTLRATLAAAPAIPAALALGSAMLQLDIAERGPEVAEVAFPSGFHVPIAVRRAYRVVRHKARLEHLWVGGLPVHSPATVLVHLAARPTDVRSWGGVLGHLPELYAVAGKTGIVVELEGRRHSTHVRLAYLLSGIAPDLANELNIEPSGKVWFGHRGTLRRHSARWNIADTVLPFPPSELGPRL